MREELCQHWEYFPPHFDYFEREDRVIIADMIVADKVNSIAEFACGTGIMPKMLRERGFKGKYLGTDITQNFLDASRKHNPDEEFIFADLDERLPLEDEEFESALLITGLGYCQDIEQTLLEIKRVVRRFIYIDQWNLFAEENDLRFLRGEGMGNQYKKEWFDEMLKRIGLKNVFEASITNAKDYYAYNNVPTSKINHIYKLEICT